MKAEIPFPFYRDSISLVQVRDRVRGRVRDRVSGRPPLLSRLDLARAGKG
jgi:hypothetical protein